MLLTHWQISTLQDVSSCDERQNSSLTYNRHIWRNSCFKHLIYFIQIFCDERKNILLITDISAEINFFNHGIYFIFVMNVKIVHLLVTDISGEINFLITEFIL
jgi:hypothetical protein